MITKNCVNYYTCNFMLFQVHVLVFTGVKSFLQIIREHVCNLVVMYNITTAYLIQEGVVSYIMLLTCSYHGNNNDMYQPLTPCLLHHQ